MSTAIETTATPLEALRRVAQRIAPVWPLDRFVAVNPYQGVQDEPFVEAAARLQRVAGVSSTLGADDLALLIADGELRLDDLDAAIVDHESRLTREGILEMLASGELDPEPATVPTVTDVLGRLTGRDWNRFFVDHLGAWFASYFDDYAAWKSAAPDSLFAAWKEEATIDRTPELMGAPEFRRHVAALPDDMAAASALALTELRVHAEATDLYLHRLGMRLGGWAAHAARIGWDRRLYDGADDDTLLEMMTVLLCFELALMRSLGDERIERAWRSAVRTTARLAGTSPRGTSLEARVILQRAYERSHQRRLVGRFEAASRETPLKQERPLAQAVFCIDVRSEVFRRHLESADPNVQTKGFAGFFGMPIELVPMGHRNGHRQCPVLVAPPHRIAEALPTREATQAAIERRRDAQGLKRAWTSFKRGAVSCFGFVGPLGLTYLPKLFSDAFGRTRPVPHPDTDGLGVEADELGVSLAVGAVDGRRMGLTLAERVELATGALRGMSLTKDFARIVLLAGHGSSSVNNPHASGLDCGACGGRSGAPNARVAAAIFNDREVRVRLKERGIDIPEDTVFLAALHDTTTDAVTVYGREQVPASHVEDVADLERSLAAAGRTSRLERAERLRSAPGGTDLDWFRRSRDWAQVRPEWGLAGCTSFVVAPRHRTATVDLGGSAFLHDYAWEADDDFSVLELIMTAPMVVTAWINLQYYASTVDPGVFGAGNKTLHNVVGGRVGVLEGNAGDLRVGLPWQSVHDGARRQHDPVRLNVVVEAPIEAMTAIIEKHESLRQLLDHGWIYLFALDENGRIGHRYAGDLQWRRCDTGSDSLREPQLQVFSQAS